MDRFDRPLTLIDTGGFEPVAHDGLLSQMAEQCRLAVEEADVIIFLLDGKEGLIICSMAAFSVFMKYARLYELRKKSSGDRNSEK